MNEWTFQMTLLISCLKNKGHSRQGWKCRLCKINVHADCKSGVGRCLPKSRLLRRQKSSSELETMTSQRVQPVNYDSQYQFQQVQPQQQQTEEEAMLGDDGAVNFGREEIDQTYIVLKQASEMAVSSSSGSVSGGSCNRRPQHHQQSSQLSSSLEQPQQQNISASDQSLGSSTGAINRPAGVMRINTSSIQLQPGTSSSSRRANPNSLSVGDPSASFLSSSSGKHMHRQGQKKGFSVFALRSQCPICFDHCDVFDGILLYASKSVPESRPLSINQVKRVIWRWVAVAVPRVCAKLTY